MEATGRIKSAANLKWSLFPPNLSKKEVINSPALTKAITKRVAAEEVISSTIKMLVAKVMDSRKE
jgi:hypothetical protein